MANTPFNQQITNALERPTSSGLNIGMANYDVQALAYSLMQSTIGSGSSGFVGSSFKVRPYSGGPSNTLVTMSRGLGFFAGTSGPSAIGGISGLNDAFDYKVMYTENRDIAIPAPCSSGNIRRDLIMISPKRTLDDYAATDIYQPSVNSFSSQNRPRTLSRDFTNESVTYIAATAVPGDGAYLVYKVGQEVSAASPNGFLDAPIPTTDPGYIGVAVINVTDSAPTGTYGEARINDIRYLLSVNGVLPVIGRATIGSTLSGSFVFPGSYLEDVRIQSAAGLTAAIYKFGAATSQQIYKLYLFTGIPALMINGDMNMRPWVNSGSATRYRGATAAILNASAITVTQAMQTYLADPLLTSPAVNVAIGQQAYEITFGAAIQSYQVSGSTATSWNSYDFSNFGTVGGVDQLTARVGFNINITF